MTITGKIVVLLLLCGFISISCSEKQETSTKEVKPGDSVKPETVPEEFKDDNYMMAISTTGWNAQFYINNQPVIFWNGGESGFFPVTSFIIDGKNTLQIKVKKHPEMKAGRDLDMRLVKRSVMDRSQSDIGGLVIENADPETSYEETVEFDATVKYQKGWQNADDITEFTDADRQSIYEFIKNISESLNQKDTTKFNSQRVFTYPDNHPKHTSFLELEEKTLKEVFQYDDFTVKITPFNNIEFKPGSKIVLTQPSGDSEYIINVGHAEENEINIQGMSQTYQLVEMYFIKRNDTWYWLDLY